MGTGAYENLRRDGMKHEDAKWPIIWEDGDSDGDNFFV
jgi:hypothetical protein